MAWLRTLLLYGNFGQRCRAVLLHEFLNVHGTARSAGRLTLTNHALYFEAIGVDFSYGEAVVYDLARDLKQSVKRESTGPWGAHLFDKAVMYKSSLT